MASQHDKIMTPELIKIIKIFGISSLVLVLLLSIFNERRANSSGSDSTIMRVALAERLFFKNVRASFYDIEGHREAKMTIYRFGKGLRKQIIQF